MNEFDRSEIERRINSLVVNAPDKVFERYEILAEIMEWINNNLNEIEALK